MTTAHWETFYRSPGFERQVRRHLRAGVQRFAVVVPPAFAPLCLAELAALGVPAAITDTGILEFDGKWEACYRANLRLRTASRVLWRLPEFRCGAVEDLFAHSARLRWELWLNPQVPIRATVHLAESRIREEGQAADALLAGMSKRLKSFGLPRPRPAVQPAADAEDPNRKPGAEIQQQILVRIQHNRCLLSIDTSGSHLHRRGYRLGHTGAPLRETLAAAVLLKAGWSGAAPLVDAMTGAGTIAVEAARLARNLAPGLDRRFQFELWPSAFADTFRHLRAQAVAAARPDAPAPIIALDHDPRAIETARENARRGRVEADIVWRQGDFFDYDPTADALPPGLVVVDPPYGKRLVGEGEAFYRRLGGALRARFRGWQAAVFSPQRAWLSRLGARSLRTWAIEHGGLAIEVGLLRID